MDDMLNFTSFQDVEEEHLTSAEVFEKLQQVSFLSGIKYNVYKYYLIKFSL